MKTTAIACAALATVLASMAVSATDKAAADLLDVEGSVIGKATFEQTPHGVLMYIEAAGLPPGGHGIHLHTVGTCTPDFSAAKGHINPEGVKHGLRNPEGPDNGNLPNLYVAADGSAQAEFFTTLVSVAAGELPALLDEDGSTVIIHEQLDDHMSQPIGGAGGRISCGVIREM